MYLTVSLLHSFSGSKLLKELKKLDDKVLLVEVQLLESKVYQELSNIPKSRYSTVYVFQSPPFVLSLV